MTYSEYHRYNRRAPDQKAVVAAAVAFLALFGGVKLPAQQTPAANRFTLEKLYTLPRVIGTAPKAPAWSPDGRQVVFLWNEEGLNFCDVYMASVDDAKAVRLTSMPRRAPSGKPAGSIEAIAEADAIENEPGVTAVRWHPEGKRLIISFQRDFYLLTPGQKPEKRPRRRGLCRDPYFLRTGSLKPIIGRAPSGWPLSAPRRFRRVKP